MNISVCLATYNGENYIAEQTISILRQLNQDDEVIIIDDCSKDNTIQKLKDLNDPRIKIFYNDENKGILFSFGRAISLANNDIIFLSDQDDIWIEGRVSLMTNQLFESNSMLVSSNTDFIDMQGNKIEYIVKQLRKVDSTKHLKNIITIFTGETGYYGCAMAFKKDFSNLILPMPAYVESHDLWIALAGNLIGSNSHLDEKTLFRRIHNKNASILRRNILLKIRSRFIHGISIITLLSRINKFRKGKFIEK